MKIEEIFAGPMLPVETLERVRKMYRIQNADEMIEYLTQRPTYPIGVPFPEKARQEVVAFFANDPENA